jgi:hypothetical protein
MERRVFSGSELEEALRSGSLNQRSYEIEGMVRAPETLNGLEFSLGDCETWVKLPLELIESFDRTGDRPCRNAIYAVFRIKFRELSDPANQQLLEDFLYKLAS